MNREQLRYEVEEWAVAICLVWSALCFGTGLALQHGTRVFSRAHGGTR